MPINIKDDDLEARIKARAQAQPVPVSMAAMARALLEDALAASEKKRGVEGHLKKKRTGAPSTARETDVSE